MLSSKATAALMKLKEIDKKYKMKSSEELARQRRSLSDISAVDSVDEILSSSAVARTGSGDSADAIARFKLDVRMPEAHMENSETRRTAGAGAAAIDGIKPPAELVRIFDESEKNSSSIISSKKSTTNRSEVAEYRTTVGPAGEGNYALVPSQRLEIFPSSSPQDSSLKEEQTIDTETAISEEVQEMVPSTPRSSSPISIGHKVASLDEESSVKSAYSSSVVNSEERAQNLADEDPSSSVDNSNTYSDDFMETVSRIVSPADAEDLSLSVNEEKKKKKKKKKKKSIVENFPGETVIAFAARVEESKAKLFADSPRTYNQPQRSRVVDGTAESITKETVELVAPKTMSRVPEFPCGNDLDSAPSDYNMKSSEHRASGKEEFEEVLDDPMRSLSRSSQTASSARGIKTRRRKGGRRAVTSRDSRVSLSREFSSSSEQKTENNLEKVSRSLKEEMPKTIVEERIKIVRKVKTDENAKNRMRAEALPSSVEPAPAPNTSNDPIQFPDVSGRRTRGLAPLADDDDTGKHRSASETEIEASKKGKNEEKVRSKRGEFDRCKNRTKKRTASRKEEPDRLGGIVRNELLQREGRDRLRARVRGYIQQIMDERERLTKVPDGFEVPVDKHQARCCCCNSGASRLRQSESPRRRRYFFKPLDLPNVAGFKRPDKDFEEHDAAVRLNRNEEYKNFSTIRDRLFDIRHWLNQQFVLYKDYTNLALTINAMYVPTSTLKETKKIIRDVQRYYNRSYRCSNCQRLK